MTETSEGDGETIPVITSAQDAKMIFADTLWHVTSLNGVARLSFVQNLADPPDHKHGDFRGRHVVTVAMPLLELPLVAEYLDETVKKMRDRGMLPELDKAAEEDAK